MARRSLVFLDRVQLEHCVHHGAAGKPPQDGIRYFAFADPSSGRGDAFTACISHRESYNGVMRVVIDYIYARHAPFDVRPERGHRRSCHAIEILSLHRTQWRQLRAGFTEEGFRKAGLRYVKSDLNRSEIYLTFLPLVMAGQVLLGRDVVDHPKGGHDDIANSVAGAAVLASIDREQHIPLVGPIVITK